MFIKPCRINNDLGRYASIRFNVGLNQRQCRSVPAVHGYLRTVVRKEPGDGGANAARTTGHQRHCKPFNRCWQNL